MFSHTSVNLEILKKRAFNLRWAKVAEGIIPLTAADPDFPCAPEIAAAICNFSNERYFCYGPPEGLSEFKESLAGYYQNKRNIPAAPEFILPVDSAAYGIYLTCKAFLEKHDEAIIFDPVDFLFRYSVESVGGIAVPFAIPAGDADIDFTLLESLISKNTRMLCLCNPLNPTGKVFTKSELMQLGEIACKYNLIILSDEIWSDIVFKPCQFVSIASLNREIRDRTITITGFSKSYGLAGLRIGSVMASHAMHFNKLMEASLHQSTVHGANVVSQVAATAALEKCEYWLNDFVAHLQSMRDLCVNEMNAISGFKCISPQGCYVAFVDIRGTNKTNIEIHRILMDQAKVAVVPGLKEWFGDGADGYIRLSFATSADILKEAILRIKNTINFI
ncbi:MAG: pyridoxal phosphate-dependent aminotransferase [Bacteroidota bacterium]|nr:pyridoxal phosphate-dependent aminotransferase [Bacteroidota bacterium]